VGNVTYLQAAKLARQGWSEHRDIVDRYVEHVENQVDLDLFSTSFQATYAVAGAEVDMGRFLAGEPECMIESTPLRIARKGRAVRLVIPFGYRGVVEPAQAVRRGAAVVALADMLAKAQHPVEIWATRSQQFGGEGPTQYHANILVQSANDPLDIDRLLFVFAHPGAYRRIGFATLNGYAGITSQGGQVPPKPEDLGEMVENTHIFPVLEADQDWSEAAAVQWVEAQLAEILA
jgi:hypothetical protein